MKTFPVHADSWHRIALITVYVLSDDVRGGYASGLHWQDHAHSVVNIHAWLDTTKAKLIILDSRENRGDTNPPLPSEGPHIQVSGCPHLLLSSSSLSSSSSVTKMDQRQVEFLTVLRKNNRSTNLLTVNHCEPGDILFYSVQTGGGFGGS